MKRFLFIIASLSTTFCFGQCDKDVTLTSSKTEYLDSLGVVQRTVTEQSTIVINKSQIIITPENPSRRDIGLIQSMTCTWVTPYQQGKTVIKALFPDSFGVQHLTTLTTEGNAGKVTFLLEVAEKPEQKIRVNVDSFKETGKN